MVGHAKREQLGGKTVGRKAQPALILEVGPGIEVLLELVIEARAAGDEVISKIGVRVAGVGGEVEYTAAIHDFSVRHEPPIGQVITSADLVGLLIDLRATSVLDEMEDALDAKVAGKVEIEISGAAVDSVGHVIGAGIGEADSDLEISFAGCCRSGLSAEHGCCSEQADEGKNSCEQLDPPERRQIAGIGDLSVCGI